jgi:hypothetical protein
MAQKEGGNRPLATAEEHIARSILVIRGQRVIMDSDLAILYGVQGKALLQAVRRNKDRFPLDFMFQLDKQELARLRSQSVTSKERGGRRYAPLPLRSRALRCSPVSCEASGRCWSTWRS